ncbi:MAG TPA: TlpA disulfide reductase family protein [Chitinophagaceae bacterium]|nr:TlpA disulfide reductase family protein [Chitinophagaceae bacterium]
MDFWFIECGGCKATLPGLKELSKKYGRKGLNIVSINSMEFDFPRVKEYIKKKNKDWINILDKSHIYRHYMIGAYPTFILIGPERKIILREIGINGFKKIKHYLNKVM